MLGSKPFYRAVAIFGVIALTGCGDMAKTRTEAEIADIATDATSDQISTLNSRLDELETKASTLESENADLRAAIDDAGGRIDTVSRHVDDVQSETDSLRAKVGY